MERAGRTTVVAAAAEGALNASSEEPLYIQLAARIAAQVSCGLLAPGQQVPSEAMLMQTYGISRVTVRQALLQLTRGGQLVSRRGKGTFVAQGPMQQDLSSLQGFREALHKQGIVPETELLEFAAPRGRPEEELPDALNLPVRLRRLYKIDAQAFAVVEACLPREAAAVGMSGAAELAVYDILQQFLGLRIVRADVGIRCARVKSNVAKELGVVPRSHVLLMQRTSYAASGCACEHTRIHIVPERYAFRMSVPGPLQIARGIQPQ